MKSPASSLRENSTHLVSYFSGGLPNGDQLLTRFLAKLKQQVPIFWIESELRLNFYPIINALVRKWASFNGYLGSRTTDSARTYQRLMDTPEYGLFDIYPFFQGTLLSPATLGREFFLWIQQVSATPRL